MTSVTSAYAQVPSNKLYVNLSNAQAFVFTSSLGVPTWISAQPAASTISTALGTTGNAIFRDLGKTLYLPSPTATPVSGAGGISTVLRKVQLVPTGLNGVYGTGGYNAGTDNDYYTGYIQLGALQQGGGGNGVPAKFVRLN